MSILKLQTQDISQVDNPRDGWVVLGFDNSGSTPGVSILAQKHSDGKIEYINESFTGTSGSSGTSGKNGSSGTSGSSGKTGSSGTSGSSGKNGSSGVVGLTGHDGTSGSSGTSGKAGTNGTSGSSGTSGKSGTSGISERTFTWVVANPAVGNILGPKLYKDTKPVSVDTYIMSPSGITFNIYYGIIGSVNTLLSSDLISVQSGSNTTDFTTTLLTSTHWLVLNISDVSGTPGMLTVTFTAS